MENGTVSQLRTLNFGRVRGTSFKRGMGVKSELRAAEWSRGVESRSFKGGIEQMQQGSSTPFRKTSSKRFEKVTLLVLNLTYRYRHATWPLNADVALHDWSRVSSGPDARVNWVGFGSGRLLLRQTPSPCPKPSVLSSTQPNAASVSKRVRL
ncbi:hypothetical protein CRG98_022531 [Punica granatum]|uniref:Uncharacterized protein n=1 Tax=Punica granatum TaxID=22663 RepID=A0A2I0JLB9_PUNGR|nr:hypothetical protein CRG98_022531 [Punica granatum]